MGFCPGIYVLFLAYITTTLHSNIYIYRYIYAGRFSLLVVFLSYNSEQTAASLQRLLRQFPPSASDIYGIIVTTTLISSHIYINLHPHPHIYTKLNTRVLTTHIFYLLCLYTEIITRLSSLKTFRDFIPFTQPINLSIYFYTFILFPHRHSTTHLTLHTHIRLFINYASVFINNSLTIMNKYVRT